MLKNDNFAESIYFRYDEFCSFFVNNIVQNKIQPPLNIGILGEWGKGKTTLLKEIQKNIRSEEIITIYFNAWLFQNEDNLWSILALRILEEFENKIGEQDEKKNLIKKLKLFVITKSKLLGKSFGRLALKNIPYSNNMVDSFKDLKNYYESEKKDDSLNSDNYEEKILTLTKYYSNTLKEQSEMENILNELMVNLNFKLVIIIDELDRIADPIQAIEVLEGIHLFLKIPNAFFFIALNTKFIKLGLLLRFKQLGYEKDDFEDFDDIVETYIEKFIQVPFFLPEFVDVDIKNYFLSLFDDKSVLSDEILIPSKSNPRWIKRIYNSYVILSNFIQNDNPQVNVILLKLIIASNRWNRDYLNWVKNSESNLLSEEFMDYMTADPNIYTKNDSTLDSLIYAVSLTKGEENVKDLKRDYYNYFNVNQKSAKRIFKEAVNLLKYLEQRIKTLRLDDYLLIRRRSSPDLTVSHSNVVIEYNGIEFLEILVNVSNDNKYNNIVLNIHRSANAFPQSFFEDKPAEKNSDTGLVTIKLNNFSEFKSEFIDPYTQIWGGRGIFDENTFRR